MPKNWGIRKAGNQNGVGTYRLQIEVPEDGMYGLKISKIRLSSRIFINGKEVGGAGNPTKSLDGFKYAFNKYTVFGESVQKKLDVVVLVANYEYPTGGIVQPINFSTAEKMMAKDNADKLFDMFFICGYILLGFIFLLHIYIEGNMFMNYILRYFV